MKKKLIILLGVFSSFALAGAIYLAYSLEGHFSDLSKIVMLHHVKTMRQHLLLNLVLVRMDVYSKGTLVPQTQMELQNHLADMEKSIETCHGCHHAPDTAHLIADLHQQVDRFKKEIISGEKDKSPAAFKEALLIGDALTDQLEPIVATTSEKLREQTEAALRKATRVKVVMLVLIGSGPIVMIIFAFTVLRGVSKPIGVLVAATRTLKAGNLEHRITGLKDEFGEVGLSFNDMADSLVGTMRAIEESEKRYRLLFEESKDAIFILDAEGDQAGKILHANQAAARMHGFTMEELETMKIQDLDVTEEAAKVSGRIRRMLKGEWIKAEGSHRRKDGTVFPVEISAGVLEIAGNKFIVGIDRDLTERKQAEQQLQRAERIRLSGELATGLAHEIKNPLAGIKVSIEALSEESYLTAEDREMLNKVSGEIMRIEYLMKGLLNFANPPKPQLLSTDVNNVLQTVASIVLKEGNRAHGAVPSIQLLSELQAELPSVMADPMQLQQVFMNLLLNAVDAMPDGGRLTMKTAFDRQANSVVIELADTGKGIGQEDMAKIFSPFFTTKEKGTGLGLSITRRLVEEHGGAIRLSTNTEGGVTCILSLPVQESSGAFVS